MKSLLCLIACSFLLIATNAVAEQSQSKAAPRGSVIDLGQLEVEGEIRRPPIDWIDSQKRAKQNLLNLYARQFALIEEALLKPASAKPKKEAPVVGR